jgi:hypothetical protein
VNAGSSLEAADAADKLLQPLGSIRNALAELRRVIRAGGELRFIEHVVSKRAGSARVQRIADRTIRPFVTGGCHVARDTLAAIEAAGFVIERSERFSFRPNPIDVTLPHIRGTARRP